MKLLGLRLLRGPNPYSMQACCVGLLSLEDGDEVGAAQWGGFAERLRAAVGGLRGIDAAAPTTLAQVAGEIALALQRAAGSEVDFLHIAPSAGDARQVRVACAYRIEAVGERALAIAVEAAAALHRAEAWTAEAAVAELRRLVERQAIDEATAGLLDAARGRGIPVLRLGETQRAFQLGWGCRQRRIEAPADPAGAGAGQGPEALDALFPAGDDGRIPLVAITGTNGKTTTTLLIAHALRALGARTGTTTTSGIYIDGRLVERGDCTGYWSAREVLASPVVEAAVLETARGGIVKRGLAFDRCDVGVVLNVSGDHLGLDGVETLADLARVKSTVARCAGAAAVLNADDAYCVAMRDALRPGCETVYFSTDAASPVLHAHLAAGGRAAFLDDGRLVWSDAAGRRPLAEAVDLPVTLRGHARYNTANALAALAALVCMGHRPAAAAAALAGFRSDVAGNPLRSNVFEVRGVTLIVDYAHNVAAYRALGAMARSHLEGTSGRLLGVVTSPGDRREGDLQAVGEACGECFDELVVYEQDPRGRAPGATVEAIVAGARTTAGGRPLHGMPAIRDALARGLSLCRAGDVLVFTCAGTLDDLVDGVRRVDPASADRLAAAIAPAA